MKLTDELKELATTKAREHDLVGNPEMFLDFIHDFLAALPVAEQEPVGYLSADREFLPLTTRRKDIAPLYLHPAEVETLERERDEWRATAEQHKENFDIPNGDLRVKLAAITAQRDLLKELVAEVEGKYFVFLKEKDVDAEKFKAEGDMYGWNFHMGEKAGAVWMHMFMTKLLKATSLKGE